MQETQSIMKGYCCFEGDTVLIEVISNQYVINRTARDIFGEMINDTDSFFTELIEATKFSSATVTLCFLALNGAKKPGYLGGFTYMSQDKDHPKSMNPSTRWIIFSKASFSLS